MQNLFGLGLNQLLSQQQAFYYSQMFPLHMQQMIQAQMTERLLTNSQFVNALLNMPTSDDIIRKVNSAKSEESTESSNPNVCQPKIEPEEALSKGAPKLCLKSKKISKKESTPQTDTVVCKKRHTWTKGEDEQIIKLVNELGYNWAEISRAMNGARSRRQIRRRYLNKLNPSLRNAEWTEVEDLLLLEMYKKLGRKWGEISRYFVGRSEFSVRNRFNKKYGKTLNENAPQEKQDDVQNNSTKLEESSAPIEESITKKEEEN